MVAVLASTFLKGMTLLGILRSNPFRSSFATHLFSPTDPDKVFFNISMRGKCDQEISVKNLEAIEFNPNIPTYVLIHGYPFNLPHLLTHSRNLRNSLLRREDCNVIIVDYLRISNVDYPSKYKIIVDVASNKIASLLKELQKEKGLDVNLVHLNGYSHGAHVAGVVGKKVKGIGSITALDPGGPGFEEDSPEKRRRRLNKTDAKRVIVLTTNTDGLFIFGHSGNLTRLDPRTGKLHFERFADFGDVTIAYNDGKFQPGCKGISICDHERVVAYYNLTICGPDLLVYKTKEQANDFACENGIPFSQVAEQLTGTFFVNTTAKYPYFRTQASFGGVGCRYGATPRRSRRVTRAKCLPPDSVCGPSKTN